MMNGQEFGGERYEWLTQPTLDRGEDKEEGINYAIQKIKTILKYNIKNKYNVT